MPDFINPYTFVPIEKKKPERMAKEKGDKSGYIECSLEIKSPTFIPNTTRVYVGERQHKEKVFYSYTNLDVKDKEVLTDELRTPKEPVIPGSEIRGMLRSVYEQLTNSCFLHIDENNLPYKRTNEPKLPAIMVYDGKSWQIYTDIKYGVDFFKGFILPMQDRSLKFTNRKPTVCENSPEATYRKYYGYGLRRIREKGHRLNAENFKFISETDENGREKTVFYSADCEFAKDGDYYIHVTPQMINKDHSNHFIMYTDKNIGNKKGRTLSVDSIIRFQYIIGVDKNGVPSDEIKGSYTNDTTNPNNDENGAIDLYKEYRQRYINHEPLFVYVDKSFAEKSLQSTAYIAPAAMSKEFFTKTIYDILENQHSHQPCDDKNKICPACRMFGMIGGNGGSKGKLRFTDTYDAENIVYYKRTNLPILATPRISSTEFYIEQPRFLTNDGNGYNGMWNYDYYIKQGERGRQNINVNLSGRKVYWNGKLAGGIDEEGIMNTTVTPLDRGSFKFKIFFDKLTDTELEQLLFCIKPSDDAIHKIGTGKPIGMGQVKLNIDAVKIKKYKKESNGKITYSLNDETFDISDEIKNSDAAKNILAYMSPMSAEEKQLVSYPIGNDGNIYKWFADNRGSVSDPYFKQVLPGILEDKILHTHN